VTKIINALLVAVAVLGLVPMATVSVAAANITIHVPADYSTIQQAIDAASDGDTVVVAAGLYQENIVIDKSLILQGAQAGLDARARSGPETIVEGDDGVGIEISRGVKRDVVINGLTVRGFRTGIAAPEPVSKDDSVNITVQYVRVENCSKGGITMAYAYKAVVEHCYVEDAEYGINAGAFQPIQPTIAIFRNNELVDTTYGITGYLQDSIIEGNVVRNFADGGVGISGQFYDTMIRSNIVTGYVKGAAMTLEWHYGRDLSRDVTVTDNTFNGNQQGIYIFPDQTELVGIAVHGNSIFGNTLYGVRNDGPATLDATRNWWGHADGPGGLGSGERDRVSARVLYSPWLAAGPGTVPMTWGVDPTGLIQDAVDAAAAGDTVRVAEGEYGEDLSIERSLILQSAGGAEATTIVGSVSVELNGGIAVFGGEGAGFTVQADGRDFGLWLCLENGSQVTVRENIITGAAAGVTTCPGGLGEGSTVAMSYNRVRLNNEHGIYLASVGVASTVLININDIADNGDDGLQVVDSAVGVDATGNWWGDGSGPYHGVANPGGTGNAISGNASFQPWLGAPLRTLKISPSPGGSVTVPGERTFVYAPGTEVDLEATPDAGHEFDRWTGDVGTIANVRGPVTTLIMDGDYSIVAKFRSLQCFVASAAYGTATAEEIDILRDFRDMVLLNSRLGSGFVSLYYRGSPYVAGFIAQREILRTVVRLGLLQPIAVVLTWTRDLWAARGS
jgi:nitrous oxidase accessory protein NosD